MAGGISRRQFMTRAGLAAASVTILPRYVLGGPGYKPPSEVLALGGIGMGGQGTGCLGTLQKRGHKVIAVCDVDKKHLERAQKKFGVVGYTDFRKLLERKDIDAVYIGTPPHWHALISIAAAQAGKDVFCEKPLCRFIKEGRAVVEAVERYGVVLQVNSRSRGSGTGKLRKIVLSGVLGPGAKVEAQRFVKGWFSVKRKCGRTDLKPEPVPPQLDYDFWLGPAPYMPYNRRRVHYNFRCYWNTAGGGLLDRGAHQMVRPQCELGKENTSPVEVEAYAPWPAHPDAVGMWGWLKMRYEDGTRIVLESGEWGEPSGEKSYTRISLTPEQEKRLNEFPNLKPNNQSFETAVRTRIDEYGRQPNAEQAHRAVTALHLANTAIRTGRKIRYDPVKEEIIGDEEANRYVHGPMRAPWHL